MRGPEPSARDLLQCRKRWCAGSAARSFRKMPSFVRSFSVVFSRTGVTRKARHSAKPQLTSELAGVRCAAAGEPCGFAEMPWTRKVWEPRRRPLPRSRKKLRAARRPGGRGAAHGSGDQNMMRSNLEQVQLPPALQALVEGRTLESVSFGCTLLEQEPNCHYSHHARIQVSS